MGGLLLTYLFCLPLALAALLWGGKMVRLKAPPDRPMRTMKLGLPVTDTAEKLMLAHSRGWMAIMFAVAIVAGPALASGRDTAPQTETGKAP